MIDATQVFDGTISGPGVATGAAVTGTRVSTNVLDLGIARDIGAGDDVEIHVMVTEAFSTGDTNSATLQVDFETCATAGGSYDVILLSPVIPKASLIIGAKLFRVKLPIMDQLLAATYRQFIRLNYTCTGAAFTAGKVFSYLSGGGDRNVTPVYPSNYTAA